VLWLLVACSGYDGRWVEFPPTPPVSLETRFLKEPDFSLTPKQAFDVRERCPRISRARATNESEGVWALEIEGERLDTVTRIEALLPKKKLAEIRFLPPNPTLLIPAACPSCEIVLGITVDGHPVACKGPGRSIQFEAGEPKAPAAM
jgi:hypothetical protein